MEVEYFTEPDPTTGLVKCIVPGRTLNMFHEINDLQDLIIREGEIRTQRMYDMIKTWR
jgi:hypothetical protein